MAIRMPQPNRGNNDDAAPPEPRNTGARHRFSARVEAAGRISVPKRILEVMKLEEGSEIEIELSLDGMIVRPVVSGRDPDQWWFWTDSWQEGEREAESRDKSSSEANRHTTEEFLGALERAAGGPG